jgi:cellulose synthase/poly-beta-1,6-N-acetylglucosamine synthase-like glycosyltransferase
VIFAARDEERSVGQSLRTMLGQDYPDLQVVAVDDRSADGTGTILDSIARGNPDVEVVHVEELPPGWLGKTHALRLGASRASGEWLLFTDADVRFSPECLRYALGYAINRDLDHVTLVPDLLSRGVMMESFVVAFQIAFSLSQRPWAVGDPYSEAHVGVGAFNLVRREVYEAIGTHAAIALRPDDDMKLAKLIKKGGFRQEVVFGRGMESVEWQESLGAAIRGLEKNAFAGLDYRLGTMIAGSALLLATNVLPFAGVFLARGRTRLMFLSAVLAVFATYSVHSRFVDTPLYLALLHPLGTTLFVYATSRSAYKAIREGAIEWRGTRYPLEELRRNVT